MTANPSPLPCADCGILTESAHLGRCPRCFGLYVERQAGADLQILLGQFLTPEEIVGLKRDAYLSPGLRPPAVKWVDQLTPFPGSRAKAEQQRWKTIKAGQHKFDELCASHEPFVGFMALFFLAIAKLRVCRRYIERVAKLLRG